MSDVESEHVGLPSAVQIASRQKPGFRFPSVRRNPAAEQLAGEVISKFVQFLRPSQFRLEVAFCSRLFPEKHSEFDAAPRRVAPEKDFQNI